MRRFIEAVAIIYCKKYFKLRLPIVIKIRYDKKFNSQFVAMWNEEEKYHLIEFGYYQIITEGSEFLQETILHELCHAEQHEKGKKNVNHNKQFYARLSVLLELEGLPKLTKEYKKAQT